MEGSIEENDIEFCIKSPVTLASGEEVTLLTQASRFIVDFSRRDVRMFAGSELHDKKFFENSIAAYKSVFQYLCWNNLNASAIHELDHEICNVRMYGRWWETGPSALKDFALKNNESYINHDFVDFVFPEKTYPLRISVIELSNPGSIIGIWAKDCKNKWHKWHRLWSASAQRLPDQQRVFTPSLKPCNFKTNVLRLEFDHTFLDYCALITGVFLIGTSEFIVPKNKTLMRDCETDFIDLWNMTPNLSPEALNDNLTEFEKTLCDNFVLYSSNTTNLQEKKASTNEKSGEIRFSNGACNSFDPLSDEMMLKIFKYLDLRSLCICSQVNNRFNRITQDALLYTSLNLRPYWNCINNLALKSLSSRCKYLRSLDISWCNNNLTTLPDDFNNFLRICGSQLNHLRLYCCDFVNDSVIEKISSICTNLRELCLCNEDLTDDGFRNLEKIECLERLEIYRADIGTETLCAIIRKNRKMRHLNLSELIDLDWDNVAIVIADSCPNLESIVCWYTSISTVGIRALTRCIRLREVDFGYCRRILRRSGGFDSKQSLRTLFSCCNKLEKVVLTGMTYLTDYDIEPLLFGPIRQLHVGGAKWLTPEMCSRIFLLCSQLQMIDLNMCYEINDAHVKKWRDLYPQVSIKWSNTGTLCTSMFL